MTEERRRGARPAEAGTGKVRSDTRRGAATRLTPFVGREHELALLSDRLEEAGRGVGGVVFIIGEPGIGKSRLLDELGATARTNGWLGACRDSRLVD